MKVPFLGADVIQTLVQAGISEVNQIAIGLVTLALMMLGGAYLYKSRHEDGKVGRFIVGALLLLGAAGFVTKFGPSPGS